MEAKPKKKKLGPILYGRFLLVIIILVGSVAVYFAIAKSLSSRTPGTINSANSNQVSDLLTASPTPVSSSLVPTPTPIPTPTYKIVHVPVLMYHYVRIVENPDQDRLGFGLSVTPADFDRQMFYLQTSGFTTITPDDLWQAIQEKKTLPAKSILLTFDDGYEDFYTAAWPILKKYNLKATAYIVNGFLNDPEGRYMTWAQVKELDKSGLITIGAHTLHHVNVATSPRAFEEINQSKINLGTFLGHPVTSFAYPGGTFNDQAVALVNKAGYDLAFTTQPGANHSIPTRLLEPRVRISGGESLTTYIKAINE